MRELDPQIAPRLPACAVVGAGRLGTALAAALHAAGPLRRGEPVPADADVVLLCVPDAQIEAAARAVPRGPLLGHCSGATGLEPLGVRESFSLHPLMSVPAGSGPEVLRGAGAAIDGSSPRALETARALAEAAGMRPARVAPEDRAAYHAAASIASNFLVTLEGAAERLAAGVGVERSLLAPLVQAAARQWAELGAERALTGPIARGDAATVERQRAAVAERAPDLLALWDALADATRALAGTPRGEAGDERSEAACMRTIRTIAELRAHLGRVRAQGRSVGLVPTMGAFHAGHHSLIRAARAAHDELVVSLFVNPAQFNEPADLAAYPRDEARDAAEAAELGADVLFAPPVEEIYPPGFATTVHVSGLTEVLEGVHRGVGHFDGVCTVVTKLMTIVAPDAAYFGQKDAQQVAVVKRLVRDLNLPVRIEVLPTVRAADGVALSSRNAHLTPQERERARALSRALGAAGALVAAGERDAGPLIAAARAELAAAGLQPEYVALVAPDSFEPLTGVDGPALLAVAARVGQTRLIDNVPLEPVGAPVATG